MGTKSSGKFLEGSLKLWHNKPWLVLLNSDGSPIEGISWENGGLINIGLVVRFPTHLVRVNALSESSNDPVVRSPAVSEVLRWKVECTSTIQKDSPAKLAFLIL